VVTERTTYLFSDAKHTIPYNFIIILTIMKLPLFNAYRRAYCTCQPKYNLNLYVGRCQHHCIYCYATKFPSFTGQTQPRLTLLEKIEKMATNTTQKLPVMLSDCTDPYQPLEKCYQVTRKCIETLAKHGFPLLIITKSDLVTRDIDLFRKTPTVVSLTITTLDPVKAELIEPNAPSPEKRINALQKLVEKGIPATVRIDPIIIGINDESKEQEKLIKTVAEVGAKQITISTLKPVRGFFKTIKTLSPRLHKKLSNTYNNGERIAGYQYLSNQKRKWIVEAFRQIILKHGLEFASCREGFPYLNTKLCDGTSYIRKGKETMITDYIET